MSFLVILRGTKPLIAKSCRPTELLGNTKGQGLLEYMILTGLIGILCLVTIRNFGETIKTKLEQASSKINKTIVIR